MKKYIKAIAVGIVAIQMQACSDLLDKNPLDQISSETFWKTQNEADMALAGVYSRILVSSFNYTQMQLDVLGGDCFSGGNVFTRIAQGLGEATSGGPINDIYAHCYQGISTCNYFLENIDRTPISEETKSRYKAEARFLRAMFYFQLSEFYGGVPIYTKTVTIDGAKVSQSTKDEVIKVVMDDLDFAIANLPNTAYNGHAVKGSAMALKAKVLLHNQKFSEAATLSADIIADGKFSLFNNYQTMFLASGQKDNPEIIFSAQYLNPDRNITPNGPDVEYLWWGAINPRQEFVDEYECIDGKPISSSPLYDSKNPKKNRDPRLAMTVKTFEEPIVKSDGIIVPNTYNTPSPSGWMPLKGCNPDAMPVDYSVKSEQDWVLLRYAEVLLMYAEARNEVSGPDESVYKAINDVRSRPGVNMPAIPTGLTKDQMRTRIMHERRVELGLEGKRYQDMKRWKTIETYVPAIVDPGGIKRVFNPAKHYLFPFPQSEIDVNDKLNQNPNY
jgi:hypothetical protein